MFSREERNVGMPMRSAATIRSPGNRQSGATLVEVLVALGLFAIGYVGIHATCNACLSIVRNQRETMAASTLLQERIEQLQAAEWRQLTNATALSQGIMALSCSQTALLDQSRERVQISTYPPLYPTPTPLIVQRQGGTATIVSAPPVGLSVRQIVAVRVDVHVDWASGDRGRRRTRELSTVIALGGLLR